MLMKSYCNTVYRDLCARLGELQIQRDSIDSEMKDILSKISLLNSMVPKLTQLETEVVSGEKTVRSNNE